MNLVTCSRCGRVFDSVAEHCLLDQKTRTYTCGKCLGHTAAPRSKSAFTPSVTPAAPTYKPRGKTGTTLRILFGVMFIITAFSSISDGDGVWFTCLCIGLGLLIWQFWPQIKALLLRKKTQEALRKQQEEYQAREAERLAREAAKKKLCPHCGATSSGFTCEYCGMPLDVS